MAQKTKCECGKRHCEFHSRYKMVFLMKENNQKNPAFYSYIKEEKKPFALLKDNMIERLEKYYKNAYRFIHFYDNQDPDRQAKPLYIHSA